MQTLATARLNARPCRPDDGPQLQAVLGDLDVRRWAVPDPESWSDAAAQNTAARMAAHWAAHGWGPRLWFDQSGVVALAGLQFAVIEGQGSVEIAFAVRRAAQGRGYARELLDAILREAGGVSHVLRATVRPDNAVALHLLRSQGFGPAAPSGVAARSGMLVLERSPS